jgi:hypothetical protein
MYDHTTLCLSAFVNRADGSVISCMSPPSSSHGSRAPSPEQPRPDPPSRDAINQVILGLGKSYLSTQRIADSDQRTPNESTSLLPQRAASAEEPASRTRAAVWASLSTVFAISLVFLLFFPQLLPDALLGGGF